MVPKFESIIFIEGSRGVFKENFEMNFVYRSQGLSSNAPDSATIGH